MKILRSVPFPVLVSCLLPVSAADPIAQWKEVTEPLTLSAKEIGSLGKGDFTLSLWLKAEEGPSGDLVLYLDGKVVAQRAGKDLAEYDLTSDAPLRVGDGVNGPLKGLLRDVRLYGEALTEETITALAGERPE